MKKVSVSVSLFKRSKNPVSFSLGHPVVSQNKASLFLLQDFSLCGFIKNSEQIIINIKSAAQAYNQIIMVGCAYQLIKNTSKGTPVHEVALIIKCPPSPPNTHPFRMVVINRTACQWWTKITHQKNISKTHISSHFGTRI